MSQFRGRTITDLEALVKSRCLITGNPCGTDTWPVGQPCQCANCKQPTPEARAESFREFIEFLDSYELPTEVLICNANRLLINMIANNVAKEVIDNQILHLMGLLKAQGEHQA